MIEAYDRRSSLNRDDGPPDRKTEHVFARFQLDVAINPRDAYAYLSMALWWHWKERYGEALDLYDRAIDLDADFAYALAGRASLRATCPNGWFCDGRLAVDDATQALVAAERHGQLKHDWKHRLYLEVLAAAHAEMGDLAAALKWQDSALEISVTKNAGKLLLKRRSHYQARQPLRLAKGMIRIGIRRPQTFS